jgi:hypothetical protein
MSGKIGNFVQENTRIVYLVFLIATGVSCFYCILLNQFNGDFYPRPVYLSVQTLLILLLICLVPYLVVWRTVGFLERFEPRQRFEVAPQPLYLLMLTLLSAHIAATALYGVGVLDQEVYSAPPLVRPFIQILNRIDAFYVGAFFILATPKRLQGDAIVIALMVTVGLMRAGLGVFNYVMIAMAIKYSAELTVMFKRAPWLVIGAALTLPAIVSALYQYRNSLRGLRESDLDMYEFLFGRFFGRLSSYSNVAYIEQNAQSFVWAAKNLEPLYYVKHAAAGVFGTQPPLHTPERLLIAGTRSYEGFSSFMAGIPGNLFMAWNVSVPTALLNLAVIATMVFAILWLSRYFGNEKARTFGFAMLLYPLTSGVANELALLLVDTIVLLAFAILFDRRVRVPKPYAV